MTGATCGAGKFYPSGAPDFIKVHVVLSFVSLFHVIVLSSGFFILIVTFV